MSIHRFQLPIPPLTEGVSWTGKSLLNWIVKQADQGMQDVLVHLREDIGGDRFRRIFEDKAAELNRRVASRVLDPRGLPADPNEGVIEAPSKDTVN
jgi:hypothetical protein